MMYSPLEAVAYAGTHPDTEVVFFAVGFETTAPATALALQQARALGYANFSVLCAHVLVPPALEWLMEQDEGRPDAFLAPRPCLRRHGGNGLRASGHPLPDAHGGDGV